jgi:hypothetical protein
MTWHLRNRDLKRYPHFDAVISADAAVKYATDPKAVTRHQFYPFIRFVQRWTRFAPQGELGRPKQRELRYAARRDAYIFAYYRSLLSAAYEGVLAETGLADKVLAYRRIADQSGKGGKCNIHFARDAFIKSRELGTCSAIALDISHYFESLDHEQLRVLWCRLLKKKKLPEDHFAVFKAITQYSVVDKERVYERLGHFGPKRITKNGKIIPGYLTAFEKIPKQLCTGKEFREKIIGKGKSIVEKNYKPYGIPQGAPISDLLANIYLLDFDLEINGLAASLGGYYYRYSDDILVLIPGGAATAKLVEAKVRDLIGTFGKKLVIKEEKSSIVSYDIHEGVQTCELVVGDDSCKQGIEYLGFRYNGKFAYIRNRTLQNLYRKVTKSARKEANAFARRYPNRTVAQLKSQFNREAFIQRFGKVEAFYEKALEYRSWTFWTYANRAGHIFGPMGQPIPRQLKRLRQIANHKIDEELVRAVCLRDDPSKIKPKLIAKKK